MAQESQTFGEAVYEDNGMYYLQYIIIRNKDVTTEIECYSDVYSLLIIKTEENGEAETAFVYDVARSYERAFELINLMKDNHVTPCTVTEILDDML